MSESDYWLGFSVFPGIGPVTFQKLLSHFGSAKKAWVAGFENLREAGLGEITTERFLDFQKKFQLEEYTKKLVQNQVTFITVEGKNYPKQLLRLPNPPIVLFLKGERKILRHDKRIAIVGTRKVTSYGRQVTELFAASLAQADFCIVSGLAMGVDAIAHTTALASDSETIAVLGCGVDCCYPTANERLYDEITSGNGLIVSEYPLGQQPTQGSFPARNRIIAALSDAVLVTEGAEDSGALITAEYALKFGIKVFAIPGPITSHLSKGPYKLIQQGAKLVTSPEEILKELGVKGGKRDRRDKRKIVGETEEEQRIIDLLQNEAIHFDEIVKLTKLDTANVGVILSLLEVRGVVSSSNNIYSLNS